jgi:hypothetical protein
MWIILRNAAWMRHRLLWRACGSHPEAWPAHANMIRAVYGW